VTGGCTQASGTLFETFFLTALPAGWLLYWQQKGYFKIRSIISGFTEWRRIETSGAVQFRIGAFTLVDL